ncbi:MAG TPA: hypothetical protein PKK69_05995, partial [Ferruginibacter sp.]|nr:hypothetical protein [Ferruginibacter sp.]
MLRKLIPVAGLCLAALSCKQKNQSYQNVFNDPILYAKTVKELNNVVKQNNFPPIIASRNYVYANIAAYEITALGDHRFASMAGHIKHLAALPAYDTANVNYQYAALLAFCKVGQAVTFPEGSMKEYVQGLDSMAMATLFAEAKLQFGIAHCNFALRGQDSE